MVSFACERCSKTFAQTSSLSRHRKRAHGQTSQKFLCPQCRLGYSRKEDVKRHCAKSGHCGDPIPVLKPRQTAIEQYFSNPQAAEPTSGGNDVTNDAETSGSRDSPTSTPSERTHSPDSEIDEAANWLMAESPEPTIDPDSDETWPVEEYYEIYSTRKAYSRQCKSVVEDYELRLTKELDAKGFADTYRKLHGLFDSAIRKLRLNAPDNARGRMVFRVSGLQRALYQTRYQDLDSLNIEEITNGICKALNSNEEAELDDGLKINFIHTEMPRGGVGNNAGSCKGRKEPNVLNWARKKRSILDVAANTGDLMCLSRVIVAGRFRAERIQNEPNPNAEDLKIWKKLREGGVRGLQRDCAYDLCVKAGVDPEKEAGLEEASKFQTVLAPKFQLVIFDHEDNILFQGEGATDARKRPIYVFLVDHHYYLIGSLKGYLNMDFACELCHKGFKVNGAGLQDLHRCDLAICGFCKNVECKNPDSELTNNTTAAYCEDCNVSFPTAYCAAAHIPQQCLKFCRCLNCSKIVKRTTLDPPEKHHCGMIRCASCKDWKLPFHLCYVQRPKNNAEKLEKAAAARKAELDALNGAATSNEEEDLTTNSGEDVDDDEPSYQHPGDNFPLLAADEAFLDYLGEGEAASDENMSDAETLGSGGSSDASNSGDGQRAQRRKRKKRKKKKKKKKHPPLRVYCDFESEFTRKDQHKATLLVMEDHKGARWEFEGPTCAEQFITFVMNEEKYHGSTMIFHGLGNYDAFLIINALHNLKKIPAKIIFRDGRILCLHLTGCNIRFIDSFLFVPLALARLPKAFNVEDLSKGYFPYRFLRPENRGYCENSMPSFECFDPDSKKEEADKEKLRLWYEAEVARLWNDSSARYDLEEELRKYCRMDVTILKNCMERFRGEMMDAFSGLDPFDNITLPSYCNRVYRSLYMPENTIPILPPNGFRGRSNQSSSALAWLDWVSSDGTDQFKKIYDIRHAGNGMEVKIGGGVYVDGYMEEADGTKRCWEFFGCYYHGHLKCQKPEKKNSSGKTMLQLHEETLERLQFLKDSGVKVTYIWECELKEMAKTNKQLKHFIDLRRKHRQPLRPRDALRGGRTNANQLYYVVKPGERIRFLDYQSLYPSTQLCTDGEFWPKGHPTVYTYDFPPINEVFGLVKMTILPPKRLYFPVLPMFINDKVLFGLCFKCMSEESKTFCNHSDEQRALTSTFVSVEVQEALRLGYKVVEIFEVWHWKEKIQDELFGGYMRTAYRDKMEASGYPHECNTEEEKEAFVQNFKEQQKIQLRPERIEENSGRRHCGKSAVTTLWGFFCKTGNPMETRYVKDHAEICRLTSDKRLSIDEVYNPYGDQLVFRFKKQEDFESPDPKCSIIIGCLCTAYGRLRLNKCLQKLQKYVLYFDTDSIIFVEVEGGPRLETGPLMGDLSDEILSKFGEHVEIHSFVCSGPKSYGIVLIDKRTGEVVKIIQKVKGIRLDVGTKQMLDLHTLEDAVFFDGKHKIKCNQIVKYVKTGEIYSRTLEKTFRCTYSKRLRLKDYKTLPLGWVALPGEEDTLLTSDA